MKSRIITTALLSLTVALAGQSSAMDETIEMTCESPKVSHSHQHAMPPIAAQLIKDGHELEMSSVQLISRANKLRKSVNELRVAIRTSQDDNAKQKLQNAADALTEQVALWQQLGATNRERSQTYITYGKTLLVQQTLANYSQDVRFNEPMTLIPSEHKMMAHNTQVRSVHPTMPKQMQDQGEAKDGMTMAVPGMGGQNIPDPLDTGLFQLSRDLNYFAYVEPLDAHHQPMVPLNEIHQWKLVITDLEGQLVSGKKIEIRGHMPGHVHGLPTQPKVTQELSPGVYLVEGMKFQMIGWWVMEFDIPTEANSDTVKFNLVL